MTRIADAALRRHPAGAEQRATRLVFFVTGFASAAWAALVPFAKARAGLTDGTLGLLLLCLGIGSIVTMPLSGAAHRAVRLPPGDRRHRYRRPARPAAACHDLVALGSGAGPDAVRRRHRRPGRRDEHPGHHRRARQRTVDDVRLPRPVQSRRHGWRRRHGAAADRRPGAAAGDVGGIAGHGRGPGAVRLQPAAVRRP